MKLRKIDFYALSMKVLLFWKISTILFSWSVKGASKSSSCFGMVFSGEASEGFSWVGGMFSGSLGSFLVLGFSFFASLF